MMSRGQRMVKKVLEACNEQDLKQSTSLNPLYECDGKQQEENYLRPVVSDNIQSLLQDSEIQCVAGPSGGTYCIHSIRFI